MNQSTVQSLEFTLFAYAQQARIKRVATGDLLKPLGLRRHQEAKLLSRLARRGTIVRIRRGLYLLPENLPLGGRWSPGMSGGLVELMDALGARYQICGPSAFYRYGWTDQVPNAHFVYNDRVSGPRAVGVNQYFLIKVAGDRLGDTDTVQEGKLSVVYSAKARSLVDAVYDWSRFASLPAAFDWILKETREDDAMPAAIVEAAIRFSNQGTLRRIGALLDSRGASPLLLKRLHVVLRPSAALFSWDPTAARTGKINTKWGIVENYAPKSSDVE
jgi:predicted transcriptional regulator of viral defense system